MIRTLIFANAVARSYLVSLILLLLGKVFLARSAFDRISWASITNQDQDCVDGTDPMWAHTCMDLFMSFSFVNFYSWADNLLANKSN